MKRGPKPGHHQDPALRERVTDAVASGTSRREASDRFRVPYSTVVRWCQRHGIIVRRCWLREIREVLR